MNKIKLPILIWDMSGDYFFEKKFLIEESNEVYIVKASNISKQISAKKTLPFELLKKELLSSIETEIIVDDRILGDALTPKFLKDEKDIRKYLKQFRALRTILTYRKFPLYSLYLNTIEPLPLDYEPLLLYDDSIFLTLLKFVQEKPSEICISYQGRTNKSKYYKWSINVEDFEPNSSMDPWYYRDVFISLRKNNQLTKWPMLEDIFSIHVPLENVPQTTTYNTDNYEGKLAWISSQQISLDANCIIADRINEYVENTNNQFKLEDNDILICLARRTDIKIAKYKNEICGKSAVARYVKVLRLKSSSKEKNIDNIMASLKSERFIHQIRMYLSDRCYKPITKYILEKIRIPPPETPQKYIPLTVAISELVSGKRENLQAYLYNLSKSFEKNMLDEQLDSLKLYHKLLYATDSLNNISFIIGSDPKQIEIIESSLAKIDKKSSYKTINISQHKYIKKSNLIEIARCKRTFLLTHSHSPLRSIGEYETYRKILQIVGRNHAFVLIHPKRETNVRKFPARRLIEHMFIDDLHEENFVAIEFDQDNSCFIGINNIDKMKIFKHRKYSEVLDELSNFSYNDKFLKKYVRSIKSLRLKIIEKRSNYFFSDKLDIETESEFRTVNPDVKKLIEQFEVLIESRERVILIEGETGVGKGRLYKTVFKNMLLKEPLIAGAQLSESLAIAQLFGHSKGSFTDATKDRHGYVTIAENEKRALVLDEINSYPLSIQWRLLMLLQDGKYEILGKEGKYNYF